MRKSSGVSVALLSAVAATGIPGEMVHAERERVVSAAPALVERGGFGEAMKNDWPIIGAFGAVLVISYFSGGE